MVRLPSNVFALITRANRYQMIAEMISAPTSSGTEAKNLEAEELEEAEWQAALSWSR